MNYQEALDYLEGLNVFGIRLGLSRITRLLELLDLPQERYRTIHVTGTNGKGSVSAMLESIIRRSAPSMARKASGEHHQAFGAACGSLYFPAPVYLQGENAGKWPDDK